MCFLFRLRDMVSRWMGSMNGYSVWADRGSIGLMGKVCRILQGLVGLLEQCGEDLPPLLEEALTTFKIHTDHVDHLLRSEETRAEDHHGMTGCVRENQQSSEWCGHHGVSLWCAQRSSAFHTPHQWRTKHCKLSIDKALGLRAC